MARMRLGMIFVFLGLISYFVFAQDIDNLRKEIYPKLRDRRCTTMTLDKCNCPDAREMKAYIDALLETGLNKEEIFYRVAKKFSLNTIVDEKMKQEIEKRLIKEAGQKRPQIILEPTSFNFGKVSKKEAKVSKIFKLFNKGQAPLMIKSIKTSCPCTSVALSIDNKKSAFFSNKGTPSNWQVEIKPGKNAGLEVVLDLEHRSVDIGSLIREATIISNDPIHPEVTIRIEAEVKD